VIKYFWSKKAWGTRFILVRDMVFKDGKTKVDYFKIRVLTSVGKEEVLEFQVPVDYSEVVQIFYTL
jgi:hypothetical protein